MDKFNFISDEEFRNNLIGDYNELEISLKNQCYKSVLILSGSIIEAILIDYLLSIEVNGLNRDDLLKYDLNTAISKCRELNIISEKSKNLSDVVKNYRNLIHPGRSIRTKNIPDKNDSIVSKSLVEIIITEIDKRKKESYGFTAEQLLNKIETDSTSEVVWHHFLKKTNNYEKKKLLLQLIPNRYYELLNSQDIFDEYPEDELILLKKFFLAVYATVNNEIKKELAQRFISILHEGNSSEVRHNIASFFTIEYFDFFDSDSKELVIEHLFGILREKENDELIYSIKGISKYLNDNQFQYLISLLLVKSIQSSSRDTTNPAKILLDNEYQLSKEKRQKIILDYIDSQKVDYSYNEKIVEIIQNIRDYITREYLPF